MVGIYLSQSSISFVLNLSHAKLGWNPVPFDLFPLLKNSLQFTCLRLLINPSQLAFLKLKTFLLVGFLREMLAFNKNSIQNWSDLQTSFSSLMSMLDIISGLLVNNKSRIPPLLWVGLLISWLRLSSLKVSKKLF